MKNLLFFLFVLISIQANTQQGVKGLAAWRSAVVNLETESLVNPRYLIDSVLESKKRVLNMAQYEQLQSQLQSTRTTTGSALYFSYKGRRYLATAKHVIFDEAMALQKLHETKAGIGIWKTFEAIALRISVRTPFTFWYKTKQLNSYAVYNHNFINKVMPYFIISDSTGDGIGVLSLQEKNYKTIDTLLQKNGYTPIVLDRVCCEESVDVSDEIFAIGFPEMVSIVGKVTLDRPGPSPQSTDVVTPFVVKGYVAMYEPNVQHYYVDLTITPGNSGSPIIKNGKLVGIVSSINKYHILQDDSPSGQSPNLQGIGHLVNIINTKFLISELEKYQKEEDKMIKNQN